MPVKPKEKACFENTPLGRSEKSLGIGTKKSKTKKSDEHTICGQPESVIRKAYFESELIPLLNKIQASDKYGENDIKKLGAFLEGLKKENELMIDNLLEVFSGKIVDDGTPPTVDELRDGADDSVWREKADKAIVFIEETLNKIREGIALKKSFASGFWSDTAFTFLSMQDLLDKDLIYKRQLYKARLTTIIDDFGVSRKEAEERAELTREYFNYRALEKLSNRLEEFYTFARRRDDETNHR